MARAASPGEVGKVDVMGDPLPRFALQRLGTVWFRASEEVNCLRVSPDSSRVLLAVTDFWSSDRNSPLVYDTVTGKLLQTLSRHEHPVHGVDYSPDGMLIASAASDGSIRIWNKESGKQLRTFGSASEPPTGIAFSPDGSQLLTSHHGDASVHVWDVSTGDEKYWLRPTDEFPSSQGVLAVSPDGRTLATDDMDDVILWRLPSTQPIAELKGHEYAVWSLAFSPDGKALASGSLDGTIRLWHVEAQATFHVLHQGASIHAVSYSPDGRWLAAGGDGGDVVLWDTAKWKVDKRLSGHVGSIDALSFSRDSRLLVTAGEGKTIRVWDLHSDRCSLPDVGHVHALSFIGFSSKHADVVTASRDGTIRRWEAESGRELRRFPADSDGTMAAALTPDGSKLATVDAHDIPDTPNRITLWELHAGRPLVECTGNFGTEPHLAFTPDGARLAVAANGKSVWIFDAATGKLILRRRFRPPTRGLTVSPAGDIIALGDQDGFVYLLDASSLETVRQFQTHPTDGAGPLAFSPDGQLLAIAASNESVAIWEVASAAPVMVLRGHTKWVNAVTWSPDARFIATGADDATVRLWDAGTGEEMAAFLGHEEPVDMVAFSGDAAKLASCSEETWALIWDLRPFAIRP